MVGAVRSPLNTADFSSYLLAAQASGAKVVVFAITGADLSNALKQASEFHLAPAQYLATPITYLSDVNALGLDVAHDLTFMQSWYWDLNDETRAFAKRFFARSRAHAERQPGGALFRPCATISRRSRRRERTTRGAVAEAMRAAPIHDVFTDHGGHPPRRPRALRPLSHAGEDPGAVEIPVGLSDGRRQNPRRRSVPPAGRRRMRARGAVALGASKKHPISANASSAPVARGLRDWSRASWRFDYKGRARASAA